MFEAAENEHLLDEATYDAKLPRLREALLAAQYELKTQGRFPVILLINGIEGAGKGETVKLLNEWMDPRLIHVETFLQPTAEERQHPPAWRYWQRLPGKGRIGVFFGNWYSQMLHGRVNKELSRIELDAAIDQAERFERMLADEGALILKFWFHLSKPQLKQRLKHLKNDPRLGWKLSPLDWRQAKVYDRFVKQGERVLRRTHHDYAPWHVVPGFDERFRSLTVGTVLLKALQRALANKPRKARKAAAVSLPSLDGRSVLTALDLSQRLDKPDYEDQLLTEQARLAKLLRDKKYRRHALVAAFEGNDAAGKGSAIRRVTGALDPRQYRIVPVAAPSDEELAQPYLWRFWRHIPRQGDFTIFDRSWYGRVLVERVEELTPVADWQRAYGEINDFEAQLHDAGIVLAKFWLAIDQDTQLERFKAREETPFKRFKITEDDWRNRDKWNLYSQAVDDMVLQTSTAVAPWTLVEANDKRFARVKVVRTLNEALERAYDKD
ncbi:MAG: polyphosphate:AMP phosphotransferase [Pseudomonas oryzihabitans]